MADVKWIKIATDIFDDEKVLLIESMPDADAIIVIWFKLLCLAGKQNNSGVFLMNERIAYTDEMLATIFRRNINTVRLALSTFEKFGMVEIVNNTITIPNWEKHQQLDALERTRESTRNRVARFRERQKLLTASSDKNTGENDCNVTSAVTETASNADRIDKNKNILATRVRAREEPAAAAGENPCGEYDESRSDLNTVQAYASRSLRKMSPTYMQELNEFLSEYGLPDDLVRFAIDEACGNDKPYWNYVASILYRYLDAGIKTVADAKAEKEKYRSGKRRNDREDEAHEEELRQQREALKRASDEYDPFDDPNSDSEVVNEVRTMLESGVSVDALRAEARKKIEELHEKQRKEAEIWA